MESFHVVGKRTPRIDAVEQVTGQAQYVPDLERPRMLYGAVLRSSIPHGRILHVDTSRAERLRGVRVVITAKDIPPDIRLAFQMWLANKRPLTGDKVRYVGDEIAAVAAESEELAYEACSLIRLELEPLPALFTPEEAMAPGAILIHEDQPGNIAGEIHRAFGGDIEEGFLKSDKVFEATYRTSAIPHCCMEARGALAEFDVRGRLTLWCPTQITHVLREALGIALKLPTSKIRVCKAHVGGGFGSRQSFDPVDMISIFLAKKSGRPVRLVKTRAEEFISDRHRYPITTALRTGVTSDGRIMAMQAKIVTDNGAYNEQGQAIGGSMLTFYRIPSFKSDANVVSTNKVYGGAFRGYGNPQKHFAVESQMDEIAEELGIDPTELRLRNACQPGDVLASGLEVGTCGFAECVEKAVAVSGWKEKKGKIKPRGIGMAGFIHVGGGTITAHGGQFSTAFIKVEYDGSVDLMTGVPDVGQGSDTVLAIIAAEELGVRAEDVRVHAGDTSISPPTIGVRGSRETFMAGNAVKLAAHQAKLQLLERAAAMLGVKAEELESAEGKIYMRTHPERFVTVPQAAAKPMYERCSSFPMGVPVLSSACYTDPVSHLDLVTGKGSMAPAWVFGTQIAEVEVDTETGEVKVLNVTAAHDVGRAINPMAVEGQLEGAIAQGVGMALSERLVYDHGVVQNQQFADFKLPTTMDVPKVKTLLVETDDPNGPFGAKGVGEAGLVPTAAAIANAIYNAVGVRIRELPITPDKILAALGKKV